LIAHNRPTLGLEEQHAADRVLAGGWVAQGREVEAFENELCGYLGIPERHAVAVSSGTAALFLAPWLLDAQGSAVACPVYPCSALVNATRLAGALPHFVDTAADSPNIDPRKLARATAVSLPTYPSLSDEELARIIEVLGNDAVLQENRASSKRGRG
jgi:perosamine synthetase